MGKSLYDNEPFDGLRTSSRIYRSTDLDVVTLLCVIASDRRERSNPLRRALEIASSLRFY
ncbi:MAG: hypothetical protein ACE5I2_11580 [Anaerolineae bacterium]